MSADSKRDLLFIPTAAPAPNYWGAHRPGDNRYANSIVAVRGATGEVVWHFQTLHHDVWDRDVGSPPILVDIRKDGQTIPSVIQLVKTGMVFAFNRETGEPLFPIEERPVPTDTDIVGEKLSPTQPFPTKPPVLVRNTISPDDAWGFTFLDKNACRKKIESMRHGGHYEPITTKGTIMYPQIGGGANWGGGAFDPETGILYVKTSMSPAVVRIVAPDRSASNPRAAEVDADFIGNSGGGTSFAPTRSGGGGLPIAKPPYGELVAIDLNVGTILWRVPFGDTPSIRNHPALQGVTLPARLGVAGAPGVIVTKGGLVLGGGSDSALYAFDKETGREIWRMELPRRSSGTPMTYRTKSGHQFIVMATGSGNNASLVAWK
jgi:quinoprotein glucose dehydrogenase